MMFDSLLSREKEEQYHFACFSVEGAKRDAEYKLGSIVSSLRRTVGYGPRSGSGTRIRSRSPSPTIRRRPKSPTKGFDSNENGASPVIRQASRSPHHRSQSPGSTFVDVADIDPEQIRTALKEFVQSFMTTERERDDSVGKISKTSNDCYSDDFTILVFVLSGS